jgi:hypothetical protein
MLKRAANIRGLKLLCNNTRSFFSSRSAIFEIDEPPTPIFRKIWLPQLDILAHRPPACLNFFVPTIHRKKHGAI